MTTITGYVYDDAGDPAVGRKVRLYRRDTGAFLVEGVTGPADEVIGDDNFASVSSLVPMNGSNGGTTFTDIKGKTWTPAGGAVTSTAHTFFGSGVGLFDGDARITTPHASDIALATGDFSIEFWARFTANNANQVIVNKGLGTGLFAYQVWVDNTNKFGFRGFDVGGSLVYNILAGSMATATNYFISARRSGNTFSLHVNNTLIGTATSGAGLRNSSSDPLSVGAYSDGTAGFLGYMGQFRVTAGVVRPTTVPTEAWPVVGGSSIELLAGQYSLDTGYTGEVQRIVLDDDAGTLHNDLIDRVVLS